MLSELPYAIVTAGVALAGLWISNILFDLGVPHYISRKVGHSAGGAAFLMCGLLFSSSAWPIILATGFTVMLAAARLTEPSAFRGVGGSGREKATIAEIWFPLVAIPVFAIAWGWLKLPLVAVTCLLFMAWGDCITGLVRFKVYGRPVKGIWGSFAMLLVCLAVSGAFMSPFWIGAVASGVAVLTEWAAGDVGLLRWADDNWAIPATSLATIFVLGRATGSL